tara:strand:+ start:8428 stop:11613 length:3186 start_codon:yes stop_codon:yes gene_type:complete
MANKKISQLSAISPVPTGALMVLANSGVSRSATVRDIAEAIEADASTTFVALTDTPGSITANSFVVGNAAGNALEFSDDLHLGTGHFLDKRVGGIISGDVTMAAGDTIYFNDTANEQNYISHNGTGVVTIGAGKFLRLTSRTGVVIYGDGQDSAITLVRSATDAGIDQGHKISLKGTQLLLSGAGNTVIQSSEDHTKGLDVSGRYYQSGVEINFSSFVTDTGGLVNVHMTGGYLDQNDSGHFVNTDMTGGYLDLNDSGHFVNTDQSGIHFVSTSITGNYNTGAGAAGHYAKWHVENGITSGLMVDDGTHLYPVSGGGSLGKPGDRWSGVNAKSINLVQTAPYNARIDSKISWSGDAYSDVVLRSSQNDNFLRLGVSSTGSLTRNVGSGHYFIFGSESGKVLRVGNKSKIEFYANMNSGITHAASAPSIELSNVHPLTIDLNKPVRFSKAFTFPTADGSEGNVLSTDGAGNVSWTTTGNIVTTQATGGFMDLNDSGNLTFAGLKDTPAGLGTALQSVVVNAAGDGLIFSGVTAGGGGGDSSTFVSLSDTPSSIGGGNANKLIGANNAGSALVFIDTGDLVGAAETGGFMDQNDSGHLVNKIESGIFLTQFFLSQEFTGGNTNLAYTGFLMDKHDSGAFITQAKLDDATNKAYTGNLMDKMDSGYLVPKSETGDFILAGAVHTGIYSDFCAEYSVNIYSAGAGTEGITVREVNPLGTSTPSNGDVGPERTQPDLFLQKGCTYKFNITGSTPVGGHFGISTGLLGTHNVAPFGMHEYLYATGQFAGDNFAATRAAALGQSLYFRVPQNAPNTLYYNAFSNSNPGAAHALNYYGGTIYLHDTGKLSADQTGGFMDKNDSGHFVNITQTGGFLDKNDSGHFVNTEQSGGFLDLNDSGHFYSRYGGPITGDVTILGSANNAFKVKNTNNSYELDAVVINDSGIFLSGAMEIRDGASHHKPVSGAGSTVNWSQGNIQYKDIAANTDFSFTNVIDGQTLTMYVKNTSTNLVNCNFASGAGAANRVKMPMDANGSTAAPQIREKRANVYTFVRINTGIFTSYVTGYDYQD